MWQTILSWIFFSILLRFCLLSGNPGLEVDIRDILLGVEVALYEMAVLRYSLKIFLKAGKRMFRMVFLELL